MTSLVETVSLPVRLTLRALDDLHSLADGVRWWSEHEVEVRAAARVADARTAALLDVERTLVEQMRLETVADTAAPLKPAARTLGRVAERLPGNRDRA